MLKSVFFLIIITIGIHSVQAQGRTYSNGPASNNWLASATANANKIFDERRYQVIEFMDNEGHTICKRVQSSKPNEPLAFASTYYIYDDLGNLVVVLPPKA